MQRRIYLDNAATSFPKPPAVFDAMLRYGTQIGSSPGRGHYAESREGSRLIRQCRERINTFIGGTSADNVVFTLNTSDALNLAIKGVVRAERLRRGASTPIRLVTTAMDHNSVLRPFAALAEEGAQVVHVAADPVTGFVDLASLKCALTPDTTMLAVNWVSNVTGTIQPIDAICAMARAAGVPTLIDIAQGLGHIAFDARATNADLLAFPGHKGLLGPQGTGGLYIRPGFEPRVATTREGGTGSISELDDQPTSMPERYEAGSHNTIGIVGLSEGVNYLSQRTMAAVREHEVELMECMLEGLRTHGCGLELADGTGAMSELRLLGPATNDVRVGTFSFVHATLTSGEMAAMLEQHFGILARAGIHCAPRAHQTLGTLDHAAGRGALRMSFGPFVTRDDVLAAVDALHEICVESRAMKANTPEQQLVRP
ncbi:MAG TPA: aminotransferase class V-fold PLP-dependent enzyme [Phycisphaerales bacterium]|nr:aminotransferase class V-fold PLP-dependent enzyme [Phycisphaerales bacterium]